MEKDHGRGIYFESLLYNDPREDAGAIDGPLKQLAELDDPVPRAEEQAPEDLVPAIRQKQPQKSAGVLRAAQGLPGTVPLG